jgi:predicted nuclease of predicted toxin-antitoxin system
MSEVRFHLDENVRRAIAEQLRRHRIDVSLTPEEGLINASDEEQIGFALGTGRVIFTQDEDLLALAQTRSHAGIVYCKQRSRSIGRIVEFLRIVHGASTAEEMYGRIEYVP